MVPGAPVEGSTEQAGARRALHTAPVGRELARNGKRVSAGAVRVQVLPNLPACGGRLVACAEATTNEGVVAARHWALGVPAHNATKRYRPSLLSCSGPLSSFFF